jgi:hypothetical protein
MEKVKELTWYVVIIILLLIIWAFVQQYGFVGKSTSKKCIFPISDYTITTNTWVNQ